LACADARDERTRKPIKKGTNLRSGMMHTV
jgi:hypothetical protein